MLSASNFFLLSHHVRQASFVRPGAQRSAAKAKSPPTPRLLSTASSVRRALGSRGPWFGSKLFPGRSKRHVATPASAPKRRHRALVAPTSEMPNNE